MAFASRFCQCVLTDYRENIKRQGCDARVAMWVLVYLLACCHCDCSCEFESRPRDWRLRHGLRLFDAVITPSMLCSAGTWTLTLEHPKVDSDDPTQDAQTHHPDEEEKQEGKGHERRRTK